MRITLVKFDQTDLLVCNVGADSTAAPLLHLTFATAQAMQTWRAAVLEVMAKAREDWAAKPAPSSTSAVFFVQ